MRTGAGSCSWCSRPTGAATPRLAEAAPDPPRAGPRCRQLEVTLPQPLRRSRPRLDLPQARAKVDEEIFRSAHRAVLERLPGDGPGALWHGHRAFAVDGSKLNLPRPLVRAGYRTPGDKAHYPQGLLSCLLYWGE